MEIRRILAPVALIASGLLFANAATAAACAVTDVTFGGNNADQCSGQTAGNEGASDFDAAFGTSWSFLAKYDLPGTSTTATFAGIKWSLTSDPGTFGDFLLSWEDVAPTGDLPLTMDIAFAVKGSPGFSLYLFNSEAFGTNPLSRSGTFLVSLTNNGGQTPDISHLSAYGRNPVSGDDDDDDNDLPEPGTLALLGLGLMGLGFSRRRTVK